MGETFAELARSGPLLAALGVSVLAGLVSFLSPCVLPLVPGYVSYVTGLAGADLDAALGTDPSGRPVPPSAPDPAGPAAGATAAGTAGTGGTAATDTAVLGRSRVRGRLLAGSLLFVAGFTAVFVAISFAIAGVGGVLARHARAVEIGVGVLVIAMGLVFAGLGPSRQFRINHRPAAGLAGAPLLGAVFALSWTPCLSPTLAAVQGLALVQGSVSRGVLLGVAYCLGLGIPFVLFALGFRRLLGVFAVIRRHSRWISRIGGALLVIVGLMLVTGLWTDFTNWLRATVGPGEVGI